MAFPPAGSSRFLRITHRLITQAEHVWIVREADASLATHAPAPSCLLCESALSLRTTWEYPNDWDRLSDTELLGLFK